MILLNKHKKYFSPSKVQMINHPLLNFNQNTIAQTYLQKKIRMFLNSKLNFREHLKTIFHKTINTVGLLPILQTLLVRLPLITIYKSFIRPHLDIVCDQTFNIRFNKKWKPFSYAVLAITSSIKGSSRENLYQKYYRQNTNIAVSEAPLFNHYYTQYLIENKAVP